MAAEDERIDAEEERVDADPRMVAVGEKLYPKDGWVAAIGDLRFAFNSSYLSSIRPCSEREPHAHDQLDKADEVDQLSHALDQLRDEVD